MSYPVSYSQIHLRHRLPQTDAELIQRSLSCCNRIAMLYEFTAHLLPECVAENGFRVHLTVI
ncbi:MAG: hypothetical protein ABIT23_09445 [Nitrosospira sp.]